MTQGTAQMPDQKQNTSHIQAIKHGKIKEKLQNSYGTTTYDACDSSTYMKSCKKLLESISYIYKLFWTQQWFSPKDL